MAQLHSTQSGEDSCIGQFDLVVIADGAGSIVRQSLSDVQPSQLEYAGYVAWRGVVGEQELPSELQKLFDGHFTFYHGPQFHMLVYLIPSAIRNDANASSEAKANEATVLMGARLVNWVWYWDVPKDKLHKLLVDSVGVQRHFSVPHQSRI